jgi:hypothetical protein
MAQGERLDIEMKRTFQFVQSDRTVSCEAAPGCCVEIPVIQGILKHPAPDTLPMLLQKPAVARKYTLEALRKCSWPVLKQFPAEWLRQCLPHARVRPARKAALEYLLS